MFSQRQFAVGAVTLCMSGVLAAQVIEHLPNSVALTASTECRAGCQGNKAGCQESQQAAVFNATAGYYLRVDSVTKIGEQKGSPGLVSEPRWINDIYPQGSTTPTRIIVRPDLATCVGEDGDTQGITRYNFQALQQR